MGLEVTHQPLAPGQVTDHLVIAFSAMPKCVAFLMYGSGTDGSHGQKHLQTLDYLNNISLVQEDLENDSSSTGL